MDQEMSAYLPQIDMNVSAKQWFNSSILMNLSLMRITSGSWIRGYLHDHKQLINGYIT